MVSSPQSVVAFPVAIAASLRVFPVLNMKGSRAATRTLKLCHVKEMETHKHHMVSELEAGFKTAGWAEACLRSLIAGD